jgi:hypothetical protein
MTLVQKALSSGFCTSLAMTPKQGCTSGVPRCGGQRHTLAANEISSVEVHFFDDNWLRTVRHLTFSCYIPLFIWLCCATARGQVFSRPAAVELIARVESVGLSITPNSLPSQSAVPSGPEGQDFVIKTAWAVQPNYTRLSLIRSISSESDELLFRCLSVESAGSAQNGEGVVALDSGGRWMRNGEGPSDEAFSSSCRRLWTQPSGSTSRANVKEDRIDLPAHSHDVHKAATKEPVGVITLALEAF